MRANWVFFFALSALTARGQLVKDGQAAFGNSVPDAHNCYPYDGQWSDRIDRALSIGFPLSIEQDLAWFNNRMVVVHNPKAISGKEPGLREHFFQRVRPIVEDALKQGDRSRWPMIILHLDFKVNDAPLLRALWDLLGEYESWITTAPKGSDPHKLAPFDVKPILVLTEDSDAQEEVFYQQLPVGGKLRLFGSAHTAPVTAISDSERYRLAATLAPEQLLIEKPTNYRRWWNNPWAVVEEGGQRNAGDWNAADAARLRALVEHTHKMGYWSRFYTLDGFRSGKDHGWDANYNFGSLDAVTRRWKAALTAGVDFISTDHYEALGVLMGRRSK